MTKAADLIKLISEEGDGGMAGGTAAVATMASDGTLANIGKIPDKGIQARDRKRRLKKEPKSE